MTQPLTPEAPVARVMNRGAPVYKTDAPDLSGHTPEAPVANLRPLPPEGSAPSPFTPEQEARVREIVREATYALEAGQIRTSSLWTLARLGIAEEPVSAVSQAPIP